MYWGGHFLASVLQRVKLKFTVLHLNDCGRVVLDLVTQSWPWVLSVEVVCPVAACLGCCGHDEDLKCWLPFPAQWASTEHWLLVQKLWPVLLSLSVASQSRDWPPWWLHAFSLCFHCLYHSQPSPVLSFVQTTLPQSMSSVLGPGKSPGQAVSSVPGQTNSFGSGAHSWSCELWPGKHDHVIQGLHIKAFRERGTWWTGRGTSERGTVTGRHSACLSGASGEDIPLKLLSENSLFRVFSPPRATERAT